MLQILVEMLLYVSTLWLSRIHFFYSYLKADAYDMTIISIFAKRNLTKKFVSHFVLTWGLKRALTSYKLTHYLLDAGKNSERQKDL